jgi:catalase
VHASPALSLTARPGDGRIATRRVAILVADQVDGDAVLALRAGLTELGAMPRTVGARLGVVMTAQGEELEIDATLETTPAVLFDAVAIPGGPQAAEVLGKLGHALEFVKDQYRHCKPILAVGAARDVLENAGVPLTLPTGDPDPGMVVVEDTQDFLTPFVAAIAAHRHPAREMDPPGV